MTAFRYHADVEVIPTEVVRERVYGRVRVAAEWTGESGVALTVSGVADERDAPAYVELFFHDVFLLLNLAAPRSFGGTISIRGGAFRVRELAFDARLFAGAATLPLADVVRWYDGLQLGTRQLATDGVAVALLQLLHLARAAEQEEQSIVRLAIAANAVVDEAKRPARLFELRDAVVSGRTPSFHPMFDDALDPRVEDATREWIEIADAAAALVIAALQERIATQRSITTR